MAKKVNTKFVIGLSVALCAAGAVFAGMKIRNYLRNRNPEVFKDLAAQAEKRGDKLEAAKNYSQAASIMHNLHQTGADALFSHAAELFMDISKNADTQDMALQAYTWGKESRKQALLENPRNKEVNAALLEDDYKDARMAPSVQTWGEVEATATTLIKSSDSVQPRLDRAEARMQKILYLSRSKGPAADAYDGVDEDIAAAMKMDPNSGRAVGLAANVMQSKAVQNALTRGLRTNEDFQKELIPDKDGKIGTFGTQMDAVQKSLADYLEKNPGQPNAAFQLSALLRKRYDLAGRTDPKLLEQSLAYGSQALESSTENIIDNGLADFMVDNFLLAKQPEKAEAIFIGIRDGAKDQPIGYYGLAQLYVRFNDLPKAIESFKDVTRHPKIGIGFEAVRNSTFQWKSLEMISWLNMELVERATSDPTAAPEQIAERSANNAKYMKEAGEYTDKLRTSHPPRGIVELLDGRAQYIGRNYPQALQALRRAESNIANNPWLAEDYRRTELTLYRLNKAQGQPGGAIESLEKVLKVNPDDLDIILLKSTLQVDLAQFEDARILLSRYLGSYDETKKVYANQDRLPQAFVDAASRLMQIAMIRSGQALPQTIEHDSSFFLIQALAAMNNEDYETAHDNALDVLDKEATNPPAFNQKAYEIAIVAGMQSKDKDPKASADAKAEAKALLARAMAKDPSNGIFLQLKVALDLPGDASTPDERRKIAAVIPDDFERHLNLASICATEGDWDGQMTELKEAEKLVEAATDADQRERYAVVIDRGFSACINAATVARGLAKKEADLADNETDKAKKQPHQTESAAQTAKMESFFSQAQTYVTKAEKLNQDGTNGLLYRGRLEFIRTEGKSGLEFLRQAVVAHPDYARAHYVLGQAYLHLAAMAVGGSQTSGTAAAAVTANKNAALEEFHQVLRLSPNDLTAVRYTVELLVANGDPSSIKEAEGLVMIGLRLAPRNPFFQQASEFLSPNLAESIKRREEMLSKNKDDTSAEALDNRARLAALYVRQKEEFGTPESVKKANMARAIELINWIHEKNKGDLRIADLLAHYLVEEDTSEVGAAKAIQIYNEYIASDDPGVRYDALMRKGDFLHSLKVSWEAYVKLVLPQDQHGLGLMTLPESKKDERPTPSLEAIIVLKKAIELQPPGKDDAERRLADVYFDMGRVSDAQAIYQSALAKETVPAIRDRVLRRLIECELKMDIPEKESDRMNFADAIKKLDDLMKADPKDVQALILRAFACIRQTTVDGEQKAKLLASAADYLNRALTIDPGNPDALYYRAQTTVDLGGEHLDSAISDLSLAMKRDQDSVKSKMLLASIYRRSQRYEEASVEFAEVVDAHPDLLEARSDYADFLMSMTRQLRTFPSESSEDFVLSIRRLNPEAKLDDLLRKSAQKYPEQTKWPFLYAQLMQLQGKPDVTLNIMEDLIKQEAGKPEILDAYMDALYKTKKFQRLADEAGGIISNKDNAQYLADHPEWTVLYLRRAAAYRSLGKEKECADDIDAALRNTIAVSEKKKDYFPFIAMLGRMIDIFSDDSLDAGERAPAERLIADRLRARLAAAPDETISKVGLIQMLMMQDQSQEAVKIAQSTTVPTDDKELRILVLRQTAMAKYHAKDFSGSEKDFKAILADYPKDLESLNNYAFMLADGMQKGPEAVQVANRALQVLSTEAYEMQVSIAYSNLYDTLGWAQLAAGNYKEAIPSLQHSLQTQPSSDTYFHLASAYWMAYDSGGKDLQNLELAKSNCQKGIELATKRKDTILPRLMDLQTKLDLPIKLAK